MSRFRDSILAQECRKTVQLGRLKVQSWTEDEVEHLRQLLPKIANGRKTRYQKQNKKSQAEKPVPKKKKH